MRIEKVIELVSELNGMISKSKGASYMSDTGNSFSVTTDGDSFIIYFNNVELLFSEDVVINQGGDGEYWVERGTRTPLKFYLLLSILKKINEVRDLVIGLKYHL